MLASAEKENLQILIPAKRPCGAPAFSSCAHSLTLHSLPTAPSKFQPALTACSFIHSFTPFTVPACGARLPACVTVRLPVALLRGCLSLLAHICPLCWAHQSTCAPHSICQHNHPFVHYLCTGVWPLCWAHLSSALRSPSVSKLIHSPSSLPTARVLERVRNIPLRAPTDNGACKGYTRSGT